MKLVGPSPFLRLTRMAGLASALTLPLAACNKDEGAAGGPGAKGQAATAAARAELPAFLKHVPADTPYVFANLEPAPKAVADKIFAKLEPIMSELNGTLEAELAKIPADSQETGAKVARAVLEEMKGRLNQKGLEELGFSAQPRMVVYGIGLLPAIRLELKNPEAFKAAVARVETKAGQKLTVTKTGDVEHWIVEENNGFFVAAVQGNELVVGLGPAKAKDLYLPVLLGVKKPAATLEGGGALSQIISDYKFTPHGAGFADVKAIAAILMGDATGLNADIFAAMRSEGAAPLAPECKTEIAGLVAAAPRAVFGYEEFNDQSMVANLVVETRSDISNDLKSLRVPVPGLSATPTGNPVFMLGLGIDVEKALALAKAKATAIQAAPYKCADLNELNEMANNILAGLSQQQMPPFINMVKGASLMVKDARIDPTALGFNPANALSDAKAYLTIAAPNPSELLGAVKLMLPPNIAALQINPDGKPVAIPTEGLPPALKTPSVTMTPNALALTTGDGMQTEIVDILKAPPVGDPPLFLFGYHLGKVMNAMAEKLQQTISTLPPDQQAKIQADLARQKAIGELIGLVAFSLHANDKGLVLKPRVNWN